MENTQYWNQFYNKKSLVLKPSPFAEWCLSEQYIQPSQKTLELGCGNGRDAFYFIDKGIFTFGLDASGAAIKINNEKLVADGHAKLGGFLELDFENIADLTNSLPFDIQNFDSVYCRFVMHAMPKKTADKVLNFLFDQLRPGATFCMEFRTTKDPLFQQGDAISADERITDHYRRFINTADFRAQLEDMGWVINYFVESNGLAVFKSEDPVVARIIAVKP
jgi:SAM-dependent methyltransferase